ncbi:MAG: O-antigen ligase family protein [Candidatus Thiodiazotropha sp. DIVDIV]
MLFFIFLFLITSEYVGIGHYLPIYSKLPITLGLAALLLLAVVSKNKITDFFKYKPASYTLIFILLTGFAMLHGFVRSSAVEPFKVQIGYFIYTIICAYLVSDKKSFRIFTLVFTIAHAALVIINVEKLGAERVGHYLAGFFLGDGNDFGWSMNLAFPLALHLATTTKATLYKYLYFALAGIIVVGIIGTQSRGSTLALGTGLLYYLTFISNKKLVGFSLLALIAIGVLIFSPANYFSRMGTLANYQEDTSAMGRIKAWGTATEMAIDHPFLGVGAGSFNSAYGRIYRKPDDPVRWISTHSVYFKVIAEYGFPGIIIYLLTIWHTIKVNMSSLNIVRQNQDRLDITPIWPQSLIWSTIAWSVCAAFLTGYLYPHLFLLMGLTIGMHRMILRELEASEPLEAVTPKKVRKF